MLTSASPPHPVLVLVNGLPPPRTASQACLAALKDSPQGSCRNLVVPKGMYIGWKAESPDPKDLPGHSVLKASCSAENGGDQPLLWFTGASLKTAIWKK